MKNHSDTDTQSDNGTNRMKSQVSYLYIDYFMFHKKVYTQNYICHFISALVTYIFVKKSNLNSVLCYMISFTHKKIYISSQPIFL